MSEGDTAPCRVRNRVERSKGGAEPGATGEETGDPGGVGVDGACRRIRPLPDAVENGRWTAGPAMAPYPRTRRTRARPVTDRETVVTVGRRGGTGSATRDRRRGVVP